MDAIAELERQAGELARAGRTAHLLGRSRSNAIVAGIPVRAFSQPSLFDEAESRLNVSNFLLLPGRVEQKAVLVLGVAYGNDKDDGSCFASAAALVEVARVLEQPLLADVDIPPALRRAFIAANDRIRDLSSQPIGGRLISTAVGARTSYRGIGASLLVAVVTKDSVFVGHVGDNVALLVRDGRARHLAVPQTLRRSPEFRARVVEDPTLQSFSDVVANVLYGDESLKMEISRAPIEDCERLILGNRLVNDLRLDDAPPGVLVDRFERECAPEHPYSSATILEADFSIA